jgi:transcriptional regulatory protein RtcR
MMKRSDFQLIAGTIAAVREGKFREDLLARINLWTFFLTSLKNRSEDIEPISNWTASLKKRDAV